MHEVTNLLHVPPATRFILQRQRRPADSGQHRDQGARDLSGCRVGGRLHSACTAACGSRSKGYQVSTKNLGLQESKMGDSLLELEKASTRRRSSSTISSRSFSCSCIQSTKALSVGRHHHNHHHPRLCGQQSRCQVFYLLSQAPLTGSTVLRLVELGSACAMRAKMELPTRPSASRSAAGLPSMQVGASLPHPVLFTAFALEGLGRRRHLCASVERDHVLEPSTTLLRCNA